MKNPLHSTSHGSGRLSGSPCRLSPAAPACTCPPILQGAPVDLNHLDLLTPVRVCDHAPRTNRPGRLPHYAAETSMK